METKLVDKYNQGLCEPHEIQELERLIEDGKVSLLELKDLTNLEQNILKLGDKAPSMELDEKITAMIRNEQKSLHKPLFDFDWNNLSFLLPRLAFAMVLIVAGFSGGYYFNRPSDDSNVSELTREVSDLKEMVMLSLLEKESATDRLKAVSLTNDMDRASQQVTEALIKTLNQDGNVNVRLAALEALHPYAKDDRVRASLIRSIANQQSPLVQVALAELMVALQEKKSVEELRKLLQEENTPEEIKQRIEQSIEVLI